MHDQGAVRGIDGAAHRREQLQPLARGQPTRLRMLGDRHAVDELERDVGEPPGRDPAFDHARDVRMLQAQQHALFAGEAAPCLGRQQALAQQLEGGVLGRVYGPDSGVAMPVAVANPIFVDVDGGGFRANGDDLGLPLPIPAGHRAPARDPASPN